MADFNISITIPDDKVSPLVDAIKWDDGGRGDTPSTLTPAQARNAMKLFLIAHMKSIYLDHKKWLAEQAAHTDDLGAS